MGRRNHRKIKQRKRMVLSHAHPGKTQLTKGSSLDFKPEQISTQETPSIQVKHDLSMGNVVGRLVIDPWQHRTCDCKKPHAGSLHNDLHHNNVLLENSHKLNSYI
ncbi:Hypothetical protein BQ3484_485 [Cedratvirus A11]|uniref:Uncharacterized protein n=1 Tax=Cedratvirus A11 TaxID=1903266 RepID=A0A1M7XV37_9VIRU|nr:Hypothetical protein BQ3484_485 [Cedratvirus A11]SHO33553.1 Hypothetical protein BQ3484_485 [Cedratvirus A11]